MIPINWSAVSAAFVDRSNKDCRKRWQKIDTRWNSGAWTESEDEKLRSGVLRDGMWWVEPSVLSYTIFADHAASAGPQLLQSSRLEVQIVHTYKLCSVICCADSLHQSVPSGGAMC